MRTRRKGMFVRFTDRARQVIVLAQDEARELGHPYVGTEHLLLGLLREAEGVAGLVLESLGISPEQARDKVEEITGHGQGLPAGHLPFTPRAKKVLDQALQEALHLGHDYIGTEHLLLSLLRVVEHDGGSVALQVLASQGAGYARVRERVLSVLAETGEQADPATRLVRLPVPAEITEVAGQLAEARRQRRAAFAAGNLDSAAALRDRELQLRARKLQLEQQWSAGIDVRAVIAENQRVHRELGRLRDLLRRHGIEPDGGTARTA